MIAGPQISRTELESAAAGAQPLRPERASRLPGMPSRRIVCASILGAATLVILPWLLPFHLVLGAYVWLVMALAGFSFYFLCREFFDSRAALFGAVVYVLNPYHLLEVHARCSMAELLVSASLPLLMLAIYRLRNQGRGKIGVAALFFAIVVLSNIPLAVVTAYGALVFMVALTVVRKSGIGPLARLAGAGALGAGLAGFLLLPAWYEKRWVLASVHAVVLPETQLVRFGVPHGHWPWALAGVEALLIVLGGLACLVCRKMKPRPDAFSGFTALYLASVVMVLPISAVIWRLAPALVYVQFPFRWLGMMGLAMSFFVAACVQHSAKGRIFAGAVLAVSLATLAGFSVLINTRADVLLPSLQRQFVDGKGYLGWPFVLPREVKIDQFGIPLNLAPSEPVAAEVTPEGGTPPREGSPFTPWQPSSRLAVTRWTAESREIVVDALQPVWLRVRLFRYPGWSVYVDGKPSEIVATDARGAVLVQVPAGRSRVTLLYRRTADQFWGIMLSLFSALALLWIAYSRDARVRPVVHADPVKG